MSSPRPSRLRTFDYVGVHRYFLTILTDDRRQVFLLADVVDPQRLLFLHIAAQKEFGVIAYCFMPDHLHALVEGQSDRADFIDFMNRFKQRSGYEYKQVSGNRLWCEGYFDRVLREDEATLAVALYILMNPVRRGLSATIEGYAFSGWSGFELSDLQLATGGLNRGGPTGELWTPPR